MQVLKKNLKATISIITTLGATYGGYKYFENFSSASTPKDQDDPYKLKAEAFDPIQYQQNFFKYGVTMIPHPEKAYKGGEDAFYANDKVLAVADGVGGWASHGVDPGKYSKELCENIKNLWLKNTSQYQQKPKKLIVDAAKLTKSVGSSTCCILTIDNDRPVLNASYIGDSGFLVLRQDEKNNNQLKQVYMSQDHQRSFNFPYQIGTNGDSPNMSLEENHQIQDKDIIVVATDGLFDNLSIPQISSIIEYELKQNKNKEADWKNISLKIAEVCYEYSLKQSYMSPFAKKGLQYGHLFMGGKSDDITIIAAQVQLKKAAAPDQTQQKQ